MTFLLSYLVPHERWPRTTASPTLPGPLLQRRSRRDASFQELTQTPSSMRSIALAEQPRGSWQAGFEMAWAAWARLLQRMAGLLAAAQPESQSKKRLARASPAGLLFSVLETVPIITINPRGMTIADSLHAGEAVLMVRIG
jgi:hypothetical protein